MIVGDQCGEIYIMSTQGMGRRVNASCILLFKIRGGYTSARILKRGGGGGGGGGADNA